MRLIASFGELLPLLVVAFASAALIALLITPLVRRLAIRLDNVDLPDHRRVNKRPIPRGGGIAVATAFIVVSIGILIANDRLALVTIPRTIEAPELFGLLVGGAVATILGVLDDTLQLRARWQLLGQVALAALAVVAGITVTFINNPFGTGNITLDGPYAIGFTMVWIIGMINSINFIDGLDGLSSGIALIAAVTLGLISMTTATNQPFVGVLCFALAGSLLGFLRWNFHPASIFIGTSGVMFVGYTLALLSILGSAKVAVALLVLGVPIIDTFWIIVRRLATGHSPFTPDRGHIHHRLLDMGLTPRPDGARDLRHLHPPRGHVVRAVGDRPGVRVHGPRGGVRPRPVPPDPRGKRRCPRGRVLRARSAAREVGSAPAAQSGAEPPGRCPVARIPSPPRPIAGARVRSRRPSEPGLVGSRDLTQAHPWVPDPGVTFDPPDEPSRPARIGRPARSV